MNNIDSPFENNDGGVDIALTPALAIRRLAEIKDELDNRGIDPLVAEEKKLREGLKKYMLDAKLDSEYDETSGWEAVMTPRSHDVWDMAAFSSLLSPTQKKRYIRRMIDEAAAKEGIANGDLSRAQLEAKGAVRKEAGQKALYVRERKGGK